MSVYQYRRNVLSTKQLKAIDQLIKPGYETSFTEEYQSKTRRRNPEYYSLKTLLQAVTDTAVLFQQYDLDEKNIKALVQSAFVELHWLQRDPTVASIDGVLYVIGGRHRLTAIASVFSALVISHSTTDVEREEEFDTYLDQLIRVDVVELDNTADLLSLIFCDNKSRSMRKAEATHLTVQQKGADADSLDSVAKTVFTTDAKPRELRDWAAQVFTRRTHPKLKPNTIQVLGEKLSAYILYGVCPGDKLTAKTELKCKTSAEFLTYADQAWDTLVNDVINREVVARNSVEIVECVIRELSLYAPAEDEDLFGVGVELPSHDFESAPTRQRSVVDSDHTF